MCVLCCVLFVVRCLSFVVLCLLFVVACCFVVVVCLSIDIGLFLSAKCCGLSVFGACWCVLYFVFDVC